jgi:phage shock protein A
MWRIFQRIFSIFKAKTETALDKIEDPVEMMRLATIEFEEAIKKSQKALADVMADLKLKEKTLEQAKLSSESWWSKAKLAKMQEDEELATKALEQKSISDAKVSEFTALVQHLQQNVELLKKQLEKNKLKLEEVRSKQSIYAAKAETAKSQKQIAESLGGLNNDALSNLSKYEEQIDKMEAKSNALTELNNVNTKLEDDFGKLEKSAKVNADMELLNQEMEKEKEAKKLKKEQDSLKKIEQSVPKKTINIDAAPPKLQIPETNKHDKLNNLFNK